MSENALCRRCGRELSPADLELGYCPICGEPAEQETDAAGGPAPGKPEEQTETVQPQCLDWLVEDEYVVCPLCRASYYKDEAPDQCERCALEPGYTDAVWQLPSREQAVVQLEHRGSGEKIQCVDGLRMGRLHTNCLRDDLYISRHHATILIRDGRTLVRDEGSGNGTKLNGVRLQPQKAHVLSFGDVLALDEQVFDVRPAEDIS